MYIHMLLCWGEHCGIYTYLYMYVHFSRGAYIYTYMYIYTTVAVQ